MTTATTTTTSATKCQTSKPLFSTIIILGNIELSSIILFLFLFLISRKDRTKKYWQYESNKTGAFGYNPKISICASYD